ncbi:helix-turn-helix transcriptional regulator [Stratiformator vulcanicus]|uniref:HTH domain protein n=1 Tax=Stratiformator vulcanicus TaxID=2527980 RepID=A0A517QWU4_9PLAN|nr:WYL domain-containing protein [Stratiformator vulcanicus]QDT36040.1 HTH domain protein [Stratiformator vulcanicus]
MSEFKQIERQFLLLRILSARKLGCTVEDLAQELDVTEKTIRRDVEFLRTMGFPLEAVEESYGRKRWKLTEPNEAVKIGATYDELLSLFVARRMLLPLAGTHLWDGLNRLMRKVRASLSEDMLKHLDRLPAGFHDTRQRFSDYSKQADVVDRLCMAVDENRIAEITYQSMRSTEPVTYRVFPYGLTNHRGTLYLTADSEEHGTFRTFKVDRVSSVTVENFKFVRDPTFNLKKFHEGSFGVYVEEGPPTTVRIRFAPQVARYIDEHYWPGCTAKSWGNDGALTTTFVLTSTEELKSWILSFGGKATVLEPEELVAAIRAEAEELVWRYQAAERE